MTVLTKLHLIGDSISVHYGPYLIKELQNHYQISQKGGATGNLDIPTGANGGNSQNVLNYLDDLSAKNFTTDLFVINCGLHDIKRMPDSYETSISLNQYQKNLEAIIKITTKLSKGMIWVTTTPVDDAIHKANTQAFERRNSDVLEYNALAEKIMLHHRIPMIDLNSFVKTLPKPWYYDHVHYPEPIRELQANFIASQILSIQGLKP